MRPVTVSLATRLRSVKSAISCSTARTSMSWKFSDSFSPVNSNSFFFASASWGVSGFTATT